jgi:uncharacterized membrane protein
MGGVPWAELHGASVHFPIALLALSFALDAAGWLLPRLAASRGLHEAAHWSLLAGACGAVPAVVSGLFMSRGVILGHDAMRMHHAFAWPAFALALGAATWRATGPGPVGQRPPAGYLAVSAAAALLVAVAGFWGGRMLSLR